MKLWFLGTLWLSSGCRCQITPLFRCQVLYPQPTRPADWSTYTHFQGQSEVLGSPLALPSALAIAPGARLQVSVSLPYPSLVLAVDMLPMSAAHLLLFPWLPSRAWETLAR